MSSGSAPRDDGASPPVDVALRLLDDAPGEAAWNMAVDAALLECADAPTLRLYSWQPHAVSLGYFQSFADFEGLPGAPPIVRRDTGGGAIHHGDELTFSLVVDARWLPHDIAASYALLHDAIRRALASHGVACERADRGAPQSARPHDRWCFERAVQNDLVVGDLKLLGSAQRRTRDREVRVLHHGSLVFRQPAFTPGVAAIADQIEPTESVRRGIRASLADEIAACLRMPLRAGSCTSTESQRARQLRADRYAHADHLRKR